MISEVDFGADITGECGARVVVVCCGFILYHELGSLADIIGAVVESCKQ